MMALQKIKLLLAAVIALFTTAAFYISILVIERQHALDEVSRYNIAWSASQAVVELARLEQHIALSASAPDDAALDVIRLRYEILVGRVTTLRSGEFDVFVAGEPERGQVIADFDEAVRRLGPIIDDLRRPGAASSALAVLDGLAPRLTGLASQANTVSGDQVSSDQAELIRLHWLFSLLAAGLIASGIVLIALLFRHNRLLQRAHGDSRRLNSDLEATGVELETANRAVGAANAELRTRNRLLTEREAALGRQNGLFDAALNNMSQGLCMFDAQERLIVCNARFLSMYRLGADVIRPGMSLEEVLGRAIDAGCCDLESSSMVVAEQGALAREGRAGLFLHELLDGRVVAISHQPLAEGGFVATYEDVTERRQAEARIAHMARHDALTDLPNRVLFRERMEEALARRSRKGGGLAVFCLDLDHFKSVNDTLGHPVGDMLLRSVAERIRATIRSEDIVARLGGDEFAIVQAGNQSPDDANALARRLVEAVNEPYMLDGNEVLAGVSIGIAVAPGDGVDPDQLLRNADMALYRAKADGRCTWRFFEPDMDARLQARRLIEIDLRKALTEDEFELHYQPLVNLTRREVVAFEALVRWRHPVRGLVSPAEFIPIAEEIGLIAPIGDWVLRHACAEAMRWPASLKIAVNLSPAQFRRRNLVAQVIAALGDSGLAAERLELEITENVLMHENEATVATLHRLRSLGVRIALDDFGTGYSSLSYLRGFPFDKIKIDQSFVRELASNPDCAAIVAAIAGLGASLGMVTTAEGVETEEQLTQIRAAGCTEAQGYLFGRPTPAADVPRAMRLFRVIRGGAAA